MCCLIDQIKDSWVQVWLKNVIFLNFIRKKNHEVKVLELLLKCRAQTTRYWPTGVILAVIANSGGEANTDWEECKASRSL